MTYSAHTDYPHATEVHAFHHIGAFYAARAERFSAKRLFVLASGNYGTASAFFCMSNPNEWPGSRKAAYNSL